MGILSVVSLSGGMDSATVLQFALDYHKERARFEEDVIYPVFFHYGSKHNSYEYQSAKSLVDWYRQQIDTAAGQCLAPLIEFDCFSLFQQFDSTLLKSSSDAIPEGHYTAPTMSQTVVPGRNLIFASVLSGFAWSRAKEIKRRINSNIERCIIWLGVHAGDHAIYPDCRPQFVESLNPTIQASTDGLVEVRAPFLFQDKFGILKYGMDAEVPYALTRTCYKDQPIACGKCGSCVERLEAFAQIGIPDPIEYER